MSRRAQQWAVVLVALGGLTVASIVVGSLANRVAPSTVVSDACETLASSALGSLQRASVEETTGGSGIAVARDLTATLVLSCSTAPFPRSLRIVATGPPMRPSGGWLTTQDTWNSAALVFPPIADDVLLVQDEVGKRVAVATFSEPPPDSGDPCVGRADPQVVLVDCGFNVVLRVPAPDGIPDAAAVRSLVATAWFGPDRQFLQAYVYEVTGSGDTARATIGVQRPPTGGDVGIEWDEMTVGDGPAQHPAGSYRFTYAPTP